MINNTTVLHDRLIGFWLVPAEPIKSLLTKLINQLADTYDAPRFMPHVTLLVTKLRPDEFPRNIIQSAAKGIPPIKLELRGIDHSPDRFKSIYIQLDSEPVISLHTSLRNFCQHPGNYQLDAHLSLLYRSLSYEKRLSIISNLQLPHGPFPFDSVIAVKPGNGQNSFHDVEQWQLFDHIALTTPNCRR